MIDKQLYLYIKETYILFNGNPQTLQLTNCLHKWQPDDNTYILYTFNELNPSLQGFKYIRHLDTPKSAQPTNFYAEPLANSRTQRPRKSSDK